jgi:hypothetical protein
MVLILPSAFWIIFPTSGAGVDGVREVSGITLLSQELELRVVVVVKGGVPPQLPHHQLVGGIIADHSIFILWKIYANKNQISIVAV